MGTFIIILALIIDAIVANIVGKVGKTKEIGYNTAFLVSFLLSPLIGLLLVIASNPLTTEQIAEQNKPKSVEPSIEENDGSSNKSLYILLIAVAIIFLLIGTGILG
jgi:hypothetical protein